MIFAESKKANKLVNARNSSKIFLMLIVICLQVLTLNLHAASRKGLADVQKCADFLSNLSTKSFHEVFEDLTQPTAINDLGKIYSRRSARVQMTIDEKLTKKHLSKDMSFQTKNPQTGNYDKFVAVPVNGQLVPMSSHNYKMLVDSTGPVLRSLRSLLQKLYSGAPLTASGLGLESLPASEVEVVLKVIQDSIYFEPSLVAPQMKDYPFLSVAGFDGAIVDPKKPRPLFYEMNLGTPSGLSNNFQMLDELLKIDKDVRQAVRDGLPYDDTFQRLRKAIESNAEKWTGNSQGISVVLSPGVFNGAHPDVAVIARETGMPLVKSSDLYQDSDGFIRLRSEINSKNDPIVTGIYGRMEESFFFQNNKDNIPLINPNLESLNKELSEKIGLNLRRGAIYKYVYDESGKAVDVERDEQGQPIFEEVWDKMRVDPIGPPDVRGSFAKAVLSRKLYFSALGGRVADDKRLFRIVSRYLAKGPVPVASPIQGLAPYELDQFYANPNLYVVKEPGNSGGVGIHFVSQLEGPQKTELIERVRRNPADFEVQLVSPIVTIPQAKTERKFINVAIDFRLFVMMDGEGSVSAGPQSFLIRTAPEGSLYTNTSRGGGYGIGVIVDEGGILTSVKNYFRTYGAPKTPIPLSRRKVISNLLEAYHALSDSLKLDKKSENAQLSKKSKSLIMDITYLLRDLMDQLDSETLGAIHQFRTAIDSESEASVLEIEKILERIIDGLEWGRIFRSQEMNLWLEQLVKQENAWIRAKSMEYRTNPFSEIPSAFISRIKFRVLDQPEVTYRFSKEALGGAQKVELAEYLTVDDPQIQAMIDEVRAGGGQIRFLKKEITSSYDGSHIGWRFQPPYFWVHLDPASPSYLTPVIAIDITAGHGLAALAHELEHFRLFKKLYQEYLDQGLDREAASRSAMGKANSPEYLLIGEKNAVAAEMQAEKDFPDSIFNEDIGIHRAKKVYDRGYVNRIPYPHFEVVRGMLYWQKTFGTEPNQQFLNSVVDEMVSLANEGRSSALAEIERLLAIENSAEQKKPRLFSELMRAKAFWTSASLYEILFYPYGLERIKENKIEDEFAKLFDRLKN